jgi:lipopolysaccharide cholinephosphotransferase
MEELHKQILSLYHKFQKVCDDNGLRYYADAGTKLGAIRHKGFIPWDDDMDILMPLADYRKLLDVTKKKDGLPDGVALWDGMSVTVGDTLLAKFNNKNTTFVLYEQLPFCDTYTGIFLDIDPLIGTPNTADKRTKFNRDLDLLIDRIMRHRMFGKSSADLHDMMAQLNHKLEQYDYEKSEFVRPGLSNTSFFTDNLLFRKTDYDKASMHRFEDTTIPVTADYKNELIKQYGKRWSVPPKNKDSHHLNHAIYDNLNPYTHYKNIYSKQEFKPLYSFIAWLQSRQDEANQTLEKAVIELASKNVYASDLENKYAEEKRKNQAIVGSVSYKIARCLTLPCRTLKKLLRGSVRHG